MDCRRQHYPCRQRQLSIIDKPPGTLTRARQPVCHCTSGKYRRQGRLPDGKGYLAMNASSAVARSIRLAGINLCGGNSASSILNYQRQMSSNVADKKEGNEKTK